MRTAELHERLARIEDYCLKKVGRQDILETAIINEVANFIAANPNLLPNLNAEFRKSPLELSTYITEKIYNKILDNLLYEINTYAKHMESSLKYSKK